MFFVKILAVFRHPSFEGEAKNNMTKTIFLGVPPKNQFLT